MLNITGGGEEKFKQDNQIHYLKPEIVFDIDPNPEDIVQKVNQLFPRKIENLL